MQHKFLHDNIGCNLCCMRSVALYMAPYVGVKALTLPNLITKKGGSNVNTLRLGMPIGG